MPGVWGGFDNRPASPPPKQLMLPRLMNLLINPFVRARDIGGDLGGAVYESPGTAVLSNGLQSDQPPQWPMIEFTSPALGALKTGRSRILLPDDFVLLNMWASASSNVQGGFRVMVYDNNRRRAITIRPVNFNTFAGQGNAQLFQRRPYPFGRTVNNNPPMAKITIVNLEAVANTIQFGFYGIICPGYVQP
jgi:hypothetical protein